MILQSEICATPCLYVAIMQSEDKSRLLGMRTDEPRHTKILLPSIFLYEFAMRKVMFGSLM